VADDLRIAFSVPGQPVPQGSMAAITRGGRAVLVHSKRKRADGSKAMTVPQWRTIVGSHARIAMKGRKLLDGPVSVSAVFYLARPKRPRCELPDTKPDLDKLQRALGDALEGTVLQQDSRIVHWDSRKVWADGAGPRVKVWIREAELRIASLP